MLSPAEEKYIKVYFFNIKVIWEMIEIDRAGFINGGRGGGGKEASKKKIIRITCTLDRSCIQFLYEKRSIEFLVFKLDFHYKLKKMSKNLKFK